MDEGEPCVHDNACACLAAGRMGVQARLPAQRQLGSRGNCQSPDAQALKDRLQLPTSTCCSLSAADRS